MGRSFNGHGTERAEYTVRDEARRNKRAARESWLERGTPVNASGEGSKRTDARTGLTMRGGDK